MLWVAVLAATSTAERTRTEERRRRSQEFINNVNSMNAVYDEAWRGFLTELEDYKTNTYQARANKYSTMANELAAGLTSLESSSANKQATIKALLNLLAPRVTSAKTASEQAFNREITYLDSENTQVTGDINSMKNQFTAAAQKAQQNRSTLIQEIQDTTETAGDQMKGNIDAFGEQLTTSLDRLGNEIKSNADSFKANATIFEENAETDLEKQTDIASDLRTLEDKWSKIYSALIDHAGDGYMEGMGGYKRGLKQAEAQANNDIEEYATKMGQEIPKLKATALAWVAAMAEPAESEEEIAMKKQAWLSLIAEQAYKKFTREGTAELKRAMAQLKKEYLGVDANEGSAMNQQHRAVAAVDALADETNKVAEDLKTHVEHVQDKNEEEASKLADNLKAYFAKYWTVLENMQEFGSNEIEQLVTKEDNNIQDTATGQLSSNEMAWIGALEILQKSIDKMKTKDAESNSQLKAGGEALSKSEGLYVQFGKILNLLDALSGTIDERLTATHAEIRNDEGSYNHKISNLKDENRNSIDLIVQKTAEKFSEAKDKVLAKFQVEPDRESMKAIADKSEGIQNSLISAAERMNTTLQVLQKGETEIVTLPLQVSQERTTHASRMSTITDGIEESKAEVANYAVDQFALAKGNMSDQIALAEEKAQNGTDRNEAWLGQVVVELGDEVKAVEDAAVQERNTSRNEMAGLADAVQTTAAESSGLLDDRREFTERNQGKIEEGMENATDVEQGIKDELSDISKEAQEKGANLSVAAQNGTAKIDAIAENAATDAINVVNHEATVYNKQLHEEEAATSTAVGESISGADAAEQDADGKLSALELAGTDRSAIDLEKGAAAAVEEGVAYSQNMQGNLTDERNKARTYGHTGVRAMSSEWQKEWIDLHNRDSAAIRKLHDTLKAQGRDTVTDLKTYLATAKTSATEMANQLGLSENELQQMLRTMDADASLLFSSTAHAKQHFDETLGDIEGELSHGEEHTRENEGVITAHIQALMRSLGLEQAHASGELSNMEVGFLQELAVLNTSHLFSQLKDKIDGLHVKKKTKMVELNMTLDAMKEEIAKFQKRVGRNTVIQKDKWVPFIPLINDTSKDIMHLFNETEHLALNDRQTVLTLLNNLTSTETELRDYVQFENARMQSEIEDTRSTGFGAGVPQIMNFMNKFDENTTFAEIVQKTTELVQNQTDIDSDLKNSIDYEVAPRVGQWRQGINEVMGQLGMEIDMDKVEAMAEAQAGMSGGSGTNGDGGVSVSENMLNEAADLKDYVRMLGRLTKEKIGKAGSSLGRVLGHLKRGRRAEVAAMERRLKKIIDQATLDGNTASDDSRELSTRMADATRESEQLRRDVQLTLLRIQNELFNKEDNSPSRADLEAKRMVMDAEFAHQSLLETASRLTETARRLPPPEAAAAFRSATQQLRAVPPDPTLERDLGIVSHM